MNSGTETELTADILQSSHITAVNSVSVPEFTGLRYTIHPMDSFTLSVVVADIVMALAFVALLVLDKKPRTDTTEPVKPAGKRLA